MRAPKTPIIDIGLAPTGTFGVIWASSLSPDTTYFALRAQEVTLQKEDHYQVYVQLKKQYHKKLEQATKHSIGTFFAITYQGNILANSLPVINSKLTEGRFTIELFDRQVQAVAIKRQLTEKDT